MNIKLGIKIIFISTMERNHKLGILKADQHHKICNCLTHLCNTFFLIFEFYFIYFLYSRFLLFIYFIHISVYMSIPISQFLPPPPPPLSPLGVHTFVLYICVSISVLQTSSYVPFF